MKKNIFQFLKEKKQLSGTVALILILCIVFVSADMPKVQANEETSGQQVSIWTGGMTEPTQGAGTAENPYQIRTAEELAYIVKNDGGANTYYKLTSDIYLNDVTAENWYENTENHAWYSLESNFQGHVDGTGHIVYGLWYKENNTGRFAGLIPRLSGGSVKNLGVRYAYVNAAHSAGGVVGYCYTGATKVIEQCFVDETVTVKTPASAAGGAGGIVGLISGVSGAEEQVDILNCYSKTTVQGASGKANGIIGSSWQSKYTMKNCYSVGAKPFSAGNANQASSLWKNSAGTVLDATVYQDIYSIVAPYNADWEPFTHVSALSAMFGEAAKTSMSGLDYETVFRIVENDTPKLRVFPEITPWIGAKTAPTKGDGTKLNPIQIRTAEELAYVIDTHGGADKYYKLLTDIYLNDVTTTDWYKNAGNKEWFSTPTGTEGAFQGCIDGGGHTVYGLWYAQTTTGVCAGLVPKLSGGSVKSLGVRYAYVNANHSAGGIVGYCVSGATKVIDQCFVDETVTVKTPANAAGGAGGIVGLISGVNKAEEQVDISNCYSKATAQGASGKANGIIGSSWQSKYTMKNCYSVGTKPFSAGNANQASALWKNSAGTVLDATVYQNVYSDKVVYSSDWESFTSVSDVSAMKGEAAKTSMPGLAYKSVFRIVENDTPKLRVFSKLAEIGYVSLSLEGNISINYYVRLSDAVKSSQDAYMQFTVGTDDVRKVYVKDVLECTKVIDGETYYLFTCYVNSIQMTETVKAQFVVDESHKETEMEYSVQEYAKKILNSATMAKVTKDLVKALLNYGSAAQEKYAPDKELANSILSSADKDLGAVSIGDSEYVSEHTGITEGISYYGSSLILDSCTVIRHYFTLETGSKIEDYTFTLDGNALKPIQKETRYYVDIPNISAYELGTMYQLDVKKSENQGTLAVTYGAMSYVKNMYKKGSTSNAMKKIVQALYQYHKAAVVYFEKNVDTDGDFTFETVEWNGPEGYVIVIPEGNSEAQKSAEILQNYYSETNGVTLSIVSDATTEIEKEILIGKTNRSQSSKSIGEKDLKVSVQGLKLVFDGGHDVTVNSAVEKFVRLAPKKGIVYTFSVTTDFVSTALNKYQYVWGDEFEGTVLNRNKFCYEPTMSGTEHLEISTDEDVIRVEGGRLKLSALLKSISSDGTAYYKTGYAVSTTDTMNFKYGYMEIRARVPFYQGAWPSFWAQSGDWLSGSRNANYMAEVDIFENMGTNTTGSYTMDVGNNTGIAGQLESTMHKWYTETDRDSIADTRTWKFSKADSLNTEYHTYGWEWTPTEMSMYVDGTKYTTFDITKSFGRDSDMSGFHDAMRINFNNYIMNSDLDWYRGLPIPEELSFDYHIDYVRLYQKQGEGVLYTK